MKSSIENRNPSPRKQQQQQQQQFRSPSKQQLPPASATKQQQQQQGMSLAELEAMLENYRIECSSRLRQINSHQLSRLASLERSLQSAIRSLDPTVACLKLGEFVATYDRDQEAVLRDVGARKVREELRGTFGPERGQDDGKKSTHHQHSRKRAHPSSPNRSTTTTTTLSSTNNNDNTTTKFVRGGGGRDKEDVFGSIKKPRHSPSKPTPSSEEEEEEGWDLLDANEASRVELGSSRLKGKAKDNNTKPRTTTNTKRLLTTRSPPPAPPPPPPQSTTTSTTATTGAPPSSLFTYTSPPPFTDAYFQQLQAQLARQIRETLDRDGMMMGEGERRKLEKRLRGIEGMLGAGGRGD
ncbi:hypothetical protein T439DRAFT_328558 [Meredithblackwellia eburnea MCA 4105]